VAEKAATEANPRVGSPELGRTVAALGDIESTERFVTLKTLELEGLE
jgi:hypothetical protein